MQTSDKTYIGIFLFGSVSAKLLFSLSEISKLCLVFRFGNYWKCYDDKHHGGGERRAHTVEGTPGFPCAGEEKAETGKPTSSDFSERLYL